MRAGTMENSFARTSFEIRPAGVGAQYIKFPKKNELKRVREAQFWFLLKSICFLEDEKNIVLSMCQIHRQTRLPKNA